MIVKIKSSSSDKYYDIDTLKLTCSCPGYTFRKNCRHVKEALKGIETNYVDVLEFLKTNTDVIEFIEKFGDDLLSNLLARGLVIEERGIIKVLR